MTDPKQKDKEIENDRKRRRDYPLYVFIKEAVRFFYPKTTLEGSSRIPAHDAVIVGNHSQMNAPIIFELYSPVKRYTWCIGEMMELKEVPSYAFQDFWSGKPAWNRWFFKALSYVIAPLAVVVFNNADTIPVYHDTRIVNTIRETMSRLQEGADIVIFPEEHTPYNRIVNGFQDKFVDVGRFYYRKTRKKLAFVPAYVCPAFKRVYIGTPVRFDPDIPIEEERKRICLYIQEEITRMAQSLPPHKVVPYTNMSKKDYPLSRDPEKTDTKQ